MLMRLVHAVVVAILVYLGCLLLGALLNSLGDVPIAGTVGAFLIQWAYVLGVLFGLLDFLGGGFGPKFGSLA